MQAKHENLIIAKKDLEKIKMKIWKNSDHGIVTSNKIIHSIPSNHCEMIKLHLMILLRQKSDLIPIRYITFGRKDL